MSTRVHEGQQMLLPAQDAVHRVALPFGERAPEAHLQKLRVTGDRVQRRAELVAHHRQELGLRARRRLGRRRDALMLDRDADQLRELLRQTLLALVEERHGRAGRPKLSAPMIRPRAVIGTTSTGPATSCSSACQRRRRGIVSREAAGARGQHVIEPFGSATTQRPHEAETRVAIERELALDGPRAAARARRRTRPAVARRARSMT